MLSVAVLTVLPARAGSLDATWTAPTTNADGSPLTDLSGYRIYYGASTSPCPAASFVEMDADSPAPGPGETVAITLLGLATSAVQYVSVAAINTSGNVSDCFTPAQGAVPRAEFSVTPTGTVNFGTVAVQTSVDRTFTVQSTGAGSVAGTVTTSAPFSIVSGASYNLAGVGATHTVTVRFTPTTGASATANVTFTANGEAISRAVTGTGVSVDTTPPIVRITAPAATSTYVTSVSQLTLTGTAADDTGIARVTWTNARGGSGTATGTTTWAAAGIVLQPGANVLSVTAQDGAGNVATITLTVTLDATPPSVAITAPTSASVYTTSTSSLTLAGTASDDGTVSDVTWRNSRGGAGTATGTTAWSAAVVLQPGTNVLTVTARDAAGNSAASSITVSLVDSTPPVISIIAPMAGSAVDGTITVSASATDDLGVVGVQFHLDGAPLGAEATTAPYTVSWNTTASTAGTHTLTAVARDAAGNTTAASPIVVSVQALVDIARAASTVVVDGALAEWNRATTVQFSGRSNTVTAYLQWDDANLYVAFRVSDAQLAAVATARDDAGLWRGDAVEIFIDTRGDRAATMQPDDYHFLVDLNNVQRDLRGTGSGRDATWNATWKSAVQLQGTLTDHTDTDSGYTVEVAIPWTQIGVTPASGMVLGINLAVDDNDPVGTPAFDSFDWAQIASGSYAQPALWKRVRLNGAPAPTVSSPLEVYRSAGAVAVDGTLAEWSGATPIRFNGLSNAAVAYLQWDDANLYVAFRVSDAQLAAAGTARDDAGLWRGDAVEIFIDTRGDRAATMQSDDYHFLVDLNNVQRDLRGTGSGRDATWNATWKSAVRLQGTLVDHTDIDSGYTVEVAIPWTQIGVTPASGMVLGINLAVDDNDPLGTPAFDSFDWAQIAPGSYAQPALWKQIRLNAGPSPTASAPMDVYRPATSVVVDGSLGEWSDAAVIQFNGLSNAVTAFLQWDDSNLYVAFHVSDAELNAVATTRDDATLWRGDAVEIFIDTHGDRATTMQPDDYHFLVDLNNVQRDLRGTGSGRDATWNATWRSAVRVQSADSGYTVEVAVPWAQIGVTPTAGMVFGINLAVDDSDPIGTPTFDSFDWAQIAPGSYAQPALWKQVRLRAGRPQ